MLTFAADCMNLVLDIGNTRWKMGLFEGGKLTSHQVVTNWTAEQLVEYGNLRGVQRVMISSVANLEDDFHNRLDQSFPVYLELTHTTPLPFENQYATPQTLGKDRLAAIAGAQALYPQKNCLVIDCGTCIKYDLLTADGVYKGGNIAPGLGMRAKAMHEFTARLPEVSQHLPSNFIGTSTETALQNGAFLGSLLEMKGFAALFETHYAPCIPVLTGGDAGFLFPHFHFPGKQLEPHLTLIGLHHILTYNHQAN